MQSTNSIAEALSINIFSAVVINTISVEICFIINLNKEQLEMARLNYNSMMDVCIKLFCT